MDFEAERKKRLEVLEEKKKRLEEMKRIKQDRENTATNNNTNTSQNIPSKERDDVDSLVNSLLLSSLETPSTTVDLSDQDKKLLSESTTLPNKQEDTKPTPTSTIKPKVLTITKSIASLEILPYIHESYDKTCQTDEITEVNSDIDDKYTNNSGVSPHKLAHRRPATARRGSGTESNLFSSPSINTNLFNTTASNAAVTSLNNTDNTTPRQQPSKQQQQHISDDDIHHILSQPSFHSFLEGSSTLIERAMGQSDVYDILKNYQDSKSLHNTRNKLLNKVLLQIESYEDSSIKHRPIMDLAFSHHHPELFLVAYGAITTTTTKKGHNSDHLTSEETSLGMVCIWSTAIHHKPEFKFHSTSPVLTARFHESDEHIVIGGCYTGQVIQWDLRTKSLPVQRSSLTGKGHKHPIYSMAFSPQAPTSNQSSTSTVVTNTELVTISVDGIMCHWDLSRLSEPTNIINLQSLSPPPLISAPGFLPGLDSSTSSSTGEGGGSGGGKAGPMPLNVTSMVFGTVVTQDKQTIHEVILGMWIYK